MQIRKPCVRALQSIKSSVSSHLYVLSSGKLVCVYDGLQMKVRCLDRVRQCSHLSFVSVGALWVVKVSLVPPLFSTDMTSFHRDTVTNNINIHYSSSRTFPDSSVGRRGQRTRGYRMRLSSALHMFNKSFHLDFKKVVYMKGIIIACVPHQLVSRTHGGG